MNKVFIIIHNNLSDNFGRCITVCDTHDNAYKYIEQYKNEINFNHHYETVRIYERMTDYNFIMKNQFGEYLYVNIEDFNIPNLKY